MYPTAAQLEESRRTHAEADRLMAEHYPIPVPVEGGAYAAEYKQYGAFQQGEESFATREEAEDWLKLMARYSSFRQLAGWINGQRVTATTTGITYENFAVSKLDAEVTATLNKWHDAAREAAKAGA